MTHYVIDMTSDCRYAVATAAHDFLLGFAHAAGGTAGALAAAFLDAVRSARIRASDLDQILVHTFSALDRHQRSRATSSLLLDRYIRFRRDGVPALPALRNCVCFLLSGLDVDDPAVQRLAETIQLRYDEPGLSLGSLFQDEKQRARVRTRFKRVTGLTFKQFLRSVRLSQAATLLATTKQRVKDVWVAVGYNDAANFNHDFAKRFGVAPGDYRGSMRSTGGHGHDPHQSSAPDTSQAVLVVEDDTAAREILDRLLSLRGYSVTAADTVRAALDVYAPSRFDAMLLDYQLPDGNGLDVLRSIRNDNRSDTTRVALMTADWDVECHLEELRTLGATLVYKPLSIGDIETLLASMLSAPRS